MKRYIALTLMFLFAFTLFAGCKGKTNDGSDGSGSSGSVQRIVDFAKEGFSVVRVGGDEKMAALASGIFKAVKENTGERLSNVDDTTEVNQKGEIIIGSTSRPQSEKAKQMIWEHGTGRANEYIVAFIDGSIVINAMSDDALSAAVSHFIETYCRECKFDTSTVDVHKDTENYTDITLSGVNIGKYKIVMPRYNVSYLVSSEAEKLHDALLKKTGYSLDIIRDDSAASEYEIIIDKANRDGVADSLSKTDYELRPDGSRLYVSGGMNYSAAVAVQKLTAMVGTASGELISSAVKGSCSESAEVLDGYKLKWTDEFDTLDRSFWFIKEGEEEKKFHDWYGMRPYRSSTADNLYTNDGKLYLRATYDDKYFYGSMINTKNSLNFTYGYMEMSARIPDGDGIWSDFWTWSNEQDHMEIDIAECWSGGSYYVNYIHEMLKGPDGKYLDITPAHSFVTKYGSFAERPRSLTEEYKANYDNSMNKEYHSIGAIWDEEKVVCVRDGEITLTYTYKGTNNEHLYRIPHYIMLSMLVGSNQLDKTPEQIRSDGSSILNPLLDADYWSDERACFIIDYVQIFQKDGWYMNFGR